MRTLLLGTDLVYNSNNDLVPVEINTNLGMDSYNLIEDDTEIFSLSNLETFISQNNFSKVTYIGALEYFSDLLHGLCDTLNIEYRYHRIATGYAIPDIPDYATHLIIRSAYDYSAIVDYLYCQNKVNFMNLIKQQSFGSEFAYMDENNQIINNITTIPNYGNHPNFILKSVLPQYDKEIYPKLFKVTNQSELDTIIQNNVDENCFLMTFHLNLNNLYYNHMKIIRSLNLLFPPDLENIAIGQYTRIPNRSIDEASVFDTVTFELSNLDRIKYLSKDEPLGPKLLDTDRVEMADSSFKTAIQLQVNDVVKTINIPNPNHIDTNRLVYSYEIDYETFVSGTTYSQNIITGKAKIDKIVDYVKITFLDDTFWEDTKNSSYLILRNNIVYFRFLDLDDPYGIRIGDQIILIDTASQGLNFVLKEIKSVETVRQIFSGWSISVQEEHLFLTQSNDTISYVAVEHNAFCVSSADNCKTVSCVKGTVCCFYPPEGGWGCHIWAYCPGCSSTTTNLTVTPEP